MFQIKCLLVCFLSYFILESNTYDTSYITPCRAEDEACMKSSAKAVLPYVAAGIPELGVPQADPIVIKNIHSELNNLKLRFTDINISGPGKANFLKVTHDTTNRTVKVILETSVSMTGHYDIQGKLMFLRTDGNGPFKFYTEKIIVTIEVKYKDIEKNGLKYWKITGFDYSYDLVEKVHMKLENLFGGNEEAAKPVHQILDKNWREVTVELGGPIMKQVITEYVNIIKKFILCIPADKLAVL